MLPSPSGPIDSPRADDANEGQALTSCSIRRTLALANCRLRYTRWDQLSGMNVRSIVPMWRSQRSPLATGFISKVASWKRTFVEGVSRENANTMSGKLGTAI